MNPSHLRLPWQRLERGQGFFVPCLDLDGVRLYVLKQAVQARIFNLKARPGIVDGVIGVWFFRPL